MKKTNAHKTAFSVTMPVVLSILVSFLLGMLTVVSMNSVRNNSEAISISPTPLPEMAYALGEVALHAEKTDCWQAIDGAVYNFSPYLSSGDHPGGGAMIKDCGTDASERYANMPPHSEYARSLLPEYRIGLLK